GPGVVCGDEATLARSSARPSGDDFAFHDDWTRRSGCLSHASFPAHVAIARVQRYYGTVRRCEVDHVFINAKTLRFRGSRSTVLPDQDSIRAINRLDHRSGMKRVDDASIDERNTFLASTRSHLSDPGQAQLSHILFVDLVQRTETLRVVCP